MSDQIGFAVIHGGKVLVRTVSDTERAAMVNWLVTEAGKMVYQADTDELIQRQFYRERDRRGGEKDVRLIQVRISPLSSTDRGTP